MRKLTVHLHLWFDDMRAENTDAAREAVESAVVSLKDTCQDELTSALESIGADKVKMEVIVY